MNCQVSSEVKRQRGVNDGQPTKVQYVSSTSGMPGYIN